MGVLVLWGVRSLELGDADVVLVAVRDAVLAGDAVSSFELLVFWYLVVSKGSWYLFADGRLTTL